jgi:hypothetical protein
MGADFMAEGVSEGLGEEAVSPIFSTKEVSTFERRRRDGGTVRAIENGGDRWEAHFDDFPRRAQLADL